MLLQEPCLLLTTFLIPWCRYAFNKLLLGISSTPEHFQRKIADLLSDLEGLEVHIDSNCVAPDPAKQKTLEDVYADKYHRTLKI